MLHKFCEVFSPSLSVPSSNLQSVKIRLDWNPKNIENLKSKNLADRLARSHFRDSLTQNMLKSNPGELTLQQTIPFEFLSDHKQVIISSSNFSWWDQSGLVWRSVRKSLCGWLIFVVSVLIFCVKNNPQPGEYRKSECTAVRAAELGVHRGTSSWGSAGPVTDRLITLITCHHPVVARRDRDQTRQQPSHHQVSTFHHLAIGLCCSFPPIFFCYFETSALSSSQVYQPLKTRTEMFFWWIIL